MNEILKCIGEIGSIDYLDFAYQMLVKLDEWEDAVCECRDWQLAEEVSQLVQQALDIIYAKDEKIKGKL